MAIISLKNSTLANIARGFAFQKATGAVPIVPVPTFTSATTSSYTVSITGFDAQFTYTVSASIGTAVRTDGNVTVSGLSANQSSTLTITASNTSKDLTFSASSAFLSLPATPTLSRSGGTTTTVTVAIGNFDSGLTYTVGASVGSATRSGNTITVTGLTEGQATTVTATASNSSGNSAQGSLATGAVPNTPTLSFASATTNSLTFTITNFNASYTYTVSSSAGSASRSGNTITVTGLGEGQTVTANATATANGVSSAQGSANGTTIALPTGGTITSAGGFRIHTFNSSGTFVAQTPLTVEYYVFGSGGGGGSIPVPNAGFGGGGGGGRYVNGTTALASGSYAVTVAAGGAAATNGSSSIFHTFTGTGGNAGSSGGPAPSPSGGPFGGAGGPSIFSGGASGPGRSGGGGGAGGAGTAGMPTPMGQRGGDGGAGLTIPWPGPGFSVGGGAGGIANPFPDTSGIGSSFPTGPGSAGGGLGARQESNPGLGPVPFFSASAGGSGTVIVRYPA